MCKQTDVYYNCGHLKFSHKVSCNSSGDGNLSDSDSCEAVYADIQDCPRLTTEAEKLSAVCPQCRNTGSIHDWFTGSPDHQINDLARRTSQSPTDSSLLTFYDPGTSDGIEPFGIQYASGSVEASCSHIGSSLDGTRSPNDAGVLPNLSSLIIHGDLEENGTKLVQSHEPSDWTDSDSDYEEHRTLDSSDDNEVGWQPYVVPNPEYLLSRSVDESQGLPWKVYWNAVYEDVEKNKDRIAW